MSFLNCGKMMYISAKEEVHLRAIIVEKRFVFVSRTFVSQRSTVRESIGCKLIIIIQQLQESQRRSVSTIFVAMYDSNNIILETKSLDYHVCVIS